MLCEGLEKVGGGQIGLPPLLHKLWARSMPKRGEWPKGQLGRSPLHVLLTGLQLQPDWHHGGRIDWSNMYLWWDNLIKEKNKTKMDWRSLIKLWKKIYKDDPVSCPFHEYISFYSSHYFHRKYRRENNYINMSLSPTFIHQHVSKRGEIIKRRHLTAIHNYIMTDFSNS